MKTIYCLCDKIIDTWIEDFVDEDTMEVISIERHDYDNFKYVISIEIPTSKQTLLKSEIFDLCYLILKIQTKDLRLNSIITKRKYTSIVNKIKESNSKKYKICESLKI